MNVDVVTQRSDVADVRTLIVDADIHPMLRSLDGLHPYLATRWRKHLQTYGNRLSAGGAGTLAPGRLAAFGRPSRLRP
jgi:hypothetical protein